jgi:hypothetical protein
MSYLYVALFLVPLFSSGSSAPLGRRPSDRHRGGIQLPARARWTWCSARHCTGALHQLHLKQSASQAECIAHLAETRFGFLAATYKHQRSSDLGLSYHLECAGAIETPASWRNGISDYRTFWRKLFGFTDLLISVIITFGSSSLYFYFVNFLGQ